MKREQGVSNLNQCTYQALAAAYAFGDHDLAKKALLTAIRTQQDDGWFHSHGPSSPNQDEVTLCLYWMIWLRQYLQVSGDLAFVQEVFPAGEDVLRYFQKGVNARGLIDGSRLLVSRPGLMVYLDDSYNQGANMGHFMGELPAFNLLWGDALAAAGELAAALDRPERAALYARKAARVWHAANDRCWDAEYGLYRDWALHKRAPTFLHAHPEGASGGSGLHRHRGCPPSRRSGVGARPRRHTAGHRLRGVAG